MAGVIDCGGLGITKAEQSQGGQTGPPPPPPPARTTPDKAQHQYNSSTRQGCVP